MKKFTAFTLVLCLAMATVAVFHEPVRAEDNPQTGVIVGCSLLIVICVLLLITGNQPAAPGNKHQAVAPQPVTAGQEENAGTASAPAPVTLEQKLKDLKAMHDSGEITDAEYKKMKAKLLLDFK